MNASYIYFCLVRPAGTGSEPLPSGRVIVLDVAR
jgi:hypothetical protein